MNVPVVTPRVRASLAAALALIALAPIAFCAPAWAQGPHGGGGGGGGGSAHGSFGGHTGGGHMGAPAANAGHAFAAPHFAGHPSYGAGAYGGYAARGNVNFAAPVHNVRVGAYANNGAVAHGNFAPGGGGARYVPGRYAPGAGFRYGRWNGGYWHGGFWPQVFWGANFAWFLPVLPAYCATYWWNSVPYYYYNDVYYTYDPSASGYVVTTPPPAQDTQDTGAPADNAPAYAPDAADSNSPPPNTSGNSMSNGGLFAYPKNGQSEEQQSSDKQECASWATGQTRADGTGSAMDYQRAMTACLQGRGYSVD
jgi:hypothetical protein